MRVRRFGPHFFAAFIALLLVLAFGQLASAKQLVPGEIGGRPLYATLTGTAEAPGPGDPDGSGSAVVTLNQGHGLVCFHIEVTGIDQVTAAHIHVAPVGVAGPVVVNFNPTVNGLQGCVSAGADLIKQIRRHPEEYYVNVHTAAFPAGAVRGQLGK
ncbi:MAG: CHRD domain-containing protein [Caldilineaceae bacterium]|nr:CHRD domain-containing protein [Caldilineaceae bacterium]